MSKFLKLLNWINFFHHLFFNFILGNFLNYLFNKIFFLTIKPILENLETLIFLITKGNSWKVFSSRVMICTSWSYSTSGRHMVNHSIDINSDSSSITSVYHINKFLLITTSTNQFVANWLISLIPWSVWIVYMSVFIRWRYLDSTVTFWT